MKGDDDMAEQTERTLEDIKQEIEEKEAALRDAQDQLSQTNLAHLTHSRKIRELENAISELKREGELN